MSRQKPWNGYDRQRDTETITADIIIPPLPVPAGP